ncbi:YfgM family protein [Aurantivibrio plasticivorans]
MADHITEEEQIEAFKRWWNENGKSLVIGVSVAVIGYFGWQTWQSQQQSANEAASLMFEDLLTAAAVTPGEELTEANRLKIVDIAEQLKTDYNSAYASNAALMLAKIYVNEGDVENAKAQLQWAIDNSGDQAISLTARLRLAELQYVQAEYDAALASLNVEANTYEPLFDELRGDIYVAQGESDNAASSYQAALDGLTEGMSQRRNFIQMKMDDLAAPAVAKASTEAEG